MAELTPNKRQKIILRHLKKQRELNFTELTDNVKSAKIDSESVKQSGALIFSDINPMKVDPDTIKTKFQFDPLSFQSDLTYLIEKELIAYDVYDTPGEKKRIHITAEGIDYLNNINMFVKHSDKIINGIIALIVSVITSCITVTLLKK